MYILLHAIATRISTSLSQFQISVPFLLHSTRCPFASCCTYLQCLFCHTACSLPCSVSFPSLVIPLPRFQFGVTFSQIFAGCHQGQQTANRVTSCLRNEEKPLLSHPSSTLCKASSTSKTAGQREEVLWRIRLSYNLFSQTHGSAAAVCAGRLYSFPGCSWLFIFCLLYLRGPHFTIQQGSSLCAKKKKEGKGQPLAPALQGMHPSSCKLCLEQP